MEELQIRAPVSQALFEDLMARSDVPKRMSPKNVFGMCLVVSGEAKSAREAARLLDLNELTFSQFLARKRAKEIRRLVEDTFVRSAPFKAYQKIVQHALGSESDAVSMRACERIRDEAGFKPTEKRQIQHSGAVATGLPTLIMDMSELSDEQKRMIYGNSANPVLIDQKD